MGARIRQRRQELGLRIVDLATLADVSPRFLSDVELGKGNITTVRLGDLATALKIPLTSLISPLPTNNTRQIAEKLLKDCSEDDLHRVVALAELALGKRTPKVIALLGVRGAGKTTVGRNLAKKLKLPFVELVHRIELIADLPLADIFTLHGETYYRRLEQQSLVEIVMSGVGCIVALPGGIIANDEARQMIKDSCHSVWLRARPEDYWFRVFAQGDTRPMQGHDHAMAELRELVRRRDPLYSQSDCTVDTTNCPIDEVVGAVLAGLEGSRFRLGE